MNDHIEPIQSVILIVYLNHLALPVAGIVYTVKNSDLLNVLETQGWDHPGRLKGDQEALLDLQLVHIDFDPFA